jgi:uncharacterized membrane protein YfcA
MTILSIPFSFVLLAIAAFIAGAMNALAGGGSFITLAALVLTGLDPRAANITSTIALFPGQVASGYAGRSNVAGIGRMPFAALAGISLGGGAVGALLLLATPPSFFAAMVPYLVLFATGVFIWGSFIRKPGAVAKPLPSRVAGLLQFAVAIYGGYFGGGIGFMMLATLTVAGMAMRNAGATKNALAAAINAMAFLVFLMAPDVAWLQAAVVSVCALAGGLVGAWMLKRVNETALRVVVICVGIALTIGLFVRD